MLGRRSNSTVDCYKRSLVILLPITLSVGYIAMRRPWTPPGEWIQQLESVRVKIVRFVYDRSTAVDKVVSLSATDPASFDPLIAAPERAEVNKTGRYVSLCPRNFDNRRLGNQLFNFAAMLHVARLTDRRVAMVRRHRHGWLDRWFEVPVTRVHQIQTELCPCLAVGEPRGLAYSPHMSTLSNRTDVARKSLLVCGWFQSWRYTVGVESALRHHLRLLSNVSTAIHEYLERIRPRSWKEQSFLRVGIHVRAGDVMRRDKWSFGYTIPRRPFFEMAMARFLSEDQALVSRRSLDHRRRFVQFIVTSDSLNWVKASINFTDISHQLNSSSSNVDIDVTYSEGHDAGFDLGLLSLCDGVIMSTGTYGWWGAWLANKTAIYYSNWPRAGSPLSGLFKRDDYFPPNWIPIGGPAFQCCRGNKVW